MATNDFIHDLVSKIAEDNIEYIVITVQKGKVEHNANAYFNIVTIDGADMITTTFEEVIANISQSNGEFMMGNPEEFDEADDDSDEDKESE
jgi:hypothetical protein